MIVYALIELAGGKTRTEGYGHNIGAMGLDALDRYLVDEKAAPLSSFLREDRATLERALAVGEPTDRIAVRRRLDELRDRPVWHDASQGVETVQALLRQLPGDEQHEGVLGDLRIYEQILQKAAAEGDLFRIQIVTQE